MAGTVVHLAHLEPWYTQWLEPAHYMIYRGELDEAMAAVAAASEQLARETDLSDDERQVLLYEIGWTPFNFVSFICTDERVAHYFELAKAAIDVPAPGPISLPTQAFYKLALMSKGITFGLIQPDIAEVRHWAGLVPEERIVPSYWMHLATLGFYLGAPDLVEDAFGELLISATGLRDSYVWLRVNLMHLIVEQRATAEDFKQLLKIMQHIGELNSYKRDFTAPAERQGFTAELQQIIGPLQARLEAEQEPPVIEVATKHIVRK